MSDEEQEEGARERLVGRRPTPRALVMTEDDEFAAAVESMVPTFQRVSHYAEVDEAEWDLLITTESFVSGYWEPSSDLYVIAFHTGDMGEVRVADMPNQRLSFAGSSKATELRVPSQVPPEFDALIESALIPAMKARAEHTTLAKPVGDVEWFPLLKTGRREVLACVWVRIGTGLGVALPGDTPKREEWVKASLKLFRRLKPDRFQQIPGWEELPEWSSGDERRIRRDLERLASERRSELERLDARQVELSTELLAASVAAESGPRRLLTAQRDELVGAVIEALSSLGFGVTAVDDLPGMEDDNLAEDLRLTDLDDEWVCLVEVKGYTKGAKATDLIQVVRHENRFQITQGSAPSAVWYLVNQFAGQDPEVRPPVLASQDDELRAWAKGSNGLALDTADLFRFVVAVEEGVLTATEARRRLREARVRTSFEELSPVEAGG